MDLDIKQIGSICSLKVKGPMKYGPGMAAFDGAVESALTGGFPNLTIDLSEMLYIDSCGIGAVVASLRRARELGGDVRLVSLSPFAERTFKMVGILPLFQVFASEGEAIESYSE